MHNLVALKQKIDTPTEIVIVSHYKPDADALGSSLGLAGYLQKKGHKVAAIMPSDYPENLSWMPGNEMVVNFEANDEVSQNSARNSIAKAKLIFCLDFSALGRIQQMENVIKNATAEKVMIDHHIQPENFAEYIYHDTSAASTCEMIYQFIEMLGDTAYIDTAIGQCLYAGIMTDTGSFRHPSTSQLSHAIAGELIKLGVNTNAIHRQIFDNSTENRLKLIGFVVSEKMVVLPEYRVVYFTITDEELKKYHSQTGDTEGIANQGLSIKGIVLSVLMVERPDGIKMSFRSVEEFAANEIATKYFNGGGHKNAAGGKMTTGGLEGTLKKLLKILPEYKEKLVKVPS